MNYKEYKWWCTSHITLTIILTMGLYKHFGFESAILYLMLELIASVLGLRLELKKLNKENKYEIN